MNLRRKKELQQELAAASGEEYAATALLDVSSDNSLMDDVEAEAVPSSDNTLPINTTASNALTYSVTGSGITISWANPIFSEADSHPKNLQPPSAQAPKPTADNNKTKRAFSHSGSSFGAEDKPSDRWSDKNLEHVRQLWSLTDLQFQQLQSMKDRLADIDHWKNNPYELIRFIMGPQGYEETEKLFRDMIVWRLEHDVDNILDYYKPPKILYDYIPSAVLQGYDKEGDPIYLERGGAMDGAGLLNRYGEEKLLKHIIWCRESASRGRWIEEYERIQGRPPTRLTIIYDMQGLCSRHMKSGVLPFLRHSLQITQLRYNGLAKRFIILRAPALFNMAWSMIKFAFPKNAQKKMIFTSPSNYLEILEKYVDLNVLPPCIYPEGKGDVAIGMPPRLDGGLIPEHISDADDYEVEIGFDTVSMGCSSFTADSDLESDITNLKVSSAEISARCKQITKGCWREVVAKSAASPPIEVCCWREIASS